MDRIFLTESHRLFFENKFILVLVIYDERNNSFIKKSVNLKTKNKYVMKSPENCINRAFCYKVKK